MQLGQAFQTRDDDIIIVRCSTANSHLNPHLRGSKGNCFVIKLVHIILRTAVTIISKIQNILSINSFKFNYGKVF